MLFSTKLIFLVLFSCLFPTLFMGFQSYVALGDQVETSTLNLLDSVAQSSSFQVQLWLEEQKATAEAIARSTDVVQNLSEINHLSSINRQDGDAYFLSLYRLNGVIHLCDESSRWFNEVCLVSADGRLILTDNGDGFTRAVERGLVDKLSKVMQGGGSVYTRVYPAARPAPEHMESTELSVGFPTMWLMSAVRGEAESQGVLACRIAVSDVAHRLFRTEANNIPVDIFLITSDGWMLSANRKIDRNQFRQIVPCGESFKQPGHSLDGYQDFDGHTVVGAWQPVPGTDFMVLVQINRDIISGPKHLAERSALSVSLGLSLLVATIGFLVAERLLKPLRRLTRAARALADGERTVRVRLRRGDEIGDLGDTFDHMAASLETTLLDLEAARDEALAAYRAKSRFLANMTHELRTPLNAIIGYSEMLMAEVGDEGKQQWAEDLGVVRRSGKDLLALINSILDLSKMEADKMSVDAEPFILLDLLQEVGQTVVPLVREKNNSYVCSYQGTDEISQDRGKLKQILLNLISNAAKFTKDGRIEVSAELAEGLLLIKVSDSGIGMSEEQCARIFDEFAQADESTTRKYGGTGLGLTIVKRFVDLLGGSVAVTSTPDHGTTFALSLPVIYRPA